MCLFGIIFREVYKANCNNYNILFDFLSIIAEINACVITVFVVYIAYEKRLLFFKKPIQKKTKKN